MRTHAFLAAALAALTAIASPIAEPQTTEDITEEEVKTFSSTRVSTFGNSLGSICGCTLLSIFAFGKVHYPGSTTYEFESTKQYWSQTAWNEPKCVFVPTSAKDVAKGVTIAKTCGTEFGIRGGGHMTAPGAASTKNGILFSMSGLKTLQLSADNNTVFVGPGNRWSDVYNYLKPYGRYAIGGRVGVVGVPGLILGGGVNYFTNKHGFSADNVKSFEIVLASGHVVTATATNSYKDLFWALKGGSSNFGIVTKFELYAYYIPKVYSGRTTFMGEDNINTFYSAVVNLTNSGYDELGAGIIPQVSYIPGTGQVGIQVLMHEGEDPDPAIFSELKKVQTMPGGGYSVRDAAAITNELGNATAGKNHVFRVHSSNAKLEAVQFMAQTFFGSMDKLSVAVPSLTSAGIAYQPIPSSTLKRGIAMGGNTFGIKPDENYIWYCLVVNWDDITQSNAVDAWLREIGKTVSEGFKANGWIGNDGREFLYLNDAHAEQDPFASYGPEELTRLKQIRDKYDPNGRVFGKNGLSKNGFKF